MYIYMCFDDGSYIYIYISNFFLNISELSTQSVFPGDPNLTQRGSCNLSIEPHPSVM